MRPCAQLRGNTAFPESDQNVLIDEMQCASNCPMCSVKEKEIEKLTLEILDLHIKIGEIKSAGYQEENVQLKKELSKLSAEAKIKVKRRGFHKFSIHFLVTDKQMNFYTGFQTKKGMLAVFRMLKKKSEDIRYWAGPHRVAVVSNKFASRQHFMPFRSLNFEGELLMTFMRLRLGLMVIDLADRFGISIATVTRITTLIKFIAIQFSSLIFTVPQENNHLILPKSFTKSPFNKVRFIIDCTEMFLETLKSLHLQSVTWSDYKHHNTVKYLVSVHPSGHFNFVSKGWGGRVSDKY